MYKLDNWHEPILEMLHWYSKRNVKFLNSFTVLSSIKEEDYEYRAWLDGSFRDLQDRSAASFYIVNKKGDIIYRQSNNYVLKEKGSISAEMNALEKLFNYLLENKLDNIIIYGDCIPVIQDQKYNAIKKRFKKINLVWVPRYLNFYADLLCTEGYGANKGTYRNRIPVSDIFCNKFKLEVIRRLMNEDFMFENNIELSQHEPKVENEIIVYNKNNFTTTITTHMALRLMERDLITVVKPNVFFTNLEDEDMESLNSLLHLALFDLKRNYNFEPQDKICNVKNNIVYLVSKDGDSYIEATTKQIKPLIDSKEVIIFGEDVLVTNCFAYELKNLELAKPPRNTSHSMNANYVTLYSFDKQQNIIINATQAKRLIKRKITELVGDNEIQCLIPDDISNFRDIYSLVKWMVQKKIPIETKPTHIIDKNRKLGFSLLSSDGNFTEIPMSEAKKMVSDNKVTVFSKSILIENNQQLA